MMATTPTTATSVTRHAAVIAPSVIPCDESPAAALVIAIDIFCRYNLSIHGYNNNNMHSIIFNPPDMLEDLTTHEYTVIHS